jgi:hypothetical protein
VNSGPKFIVFDYVLVKTPVCPARAHFVSY